MAGGLALRKVPAKHQVQALLLHRLRGWKHILPNDRAQVAFVIIENLGPVSTMLAVYAAVSMEGRRVASRLVRKVQRTPSRENWGFSSTGKLEEKQNLKQTHQMTMPWHCPSMFKVQTLKLGPGSSTLTNLPWMQLMSSSQRHNEAHWGPFCRQIDKCVDKSVDHLLLRACKTPVARCTRN